MEPFHQKTTLGERLKILRGTMTQEQFAAAIGVNTNTLRAYEKDRNSPSADVLANVCTRLNVSAQWLLLGIGEPGSDEAESGQNTGGRICHIDSAVEIVEDAIRVSGCSVTTEQKVALAAIIREELKKKAANVIAAISS